MKIHEIRWAEEAIDAMESVSDLLNYEKSWKDFLGYLEVFWAKAKDSRIPSLSTTISRIGHLRRTDELLRYLKHARDSNTHTIRPILEKVEGATGGGTLIIGGAGGGTIIRGRIEGGKAPIDLVWEGNLTFRFGLDRLEVIEVRDRAGQVYGIPLIHLGQPLKSKSRACTEFCVNGLLAGNCRIVRSHNEREEARRT